jgi:hypothetical protein
MMPDLTDDETAALIQLLRRTIDEDRCRFRRGWRR